MRIYDRHETYKIFVSYTKTRQWLRTVVIDALLVALGNLNGLRKCTFLLLPRNEPVWEINLQERESRVKVFRRLEQERFAREIMPEPCYFLIPLGFGMKRREKAQQERIIREQAEQERLEHINKLKELQAD